MVTIGTDEKPGIQTEVETRDIRGVSLDAPGDGVLLGPADLGEAPEQGDASPNELVTIRRPDGAIDAFGEESQLTQNVQDALGEGAMPVYAIPTENVSVTEDISGGLSQVPAVEDPDAFDASVELTLGDPTAVDTSGVVVNPITGDTANTDTTEVTYESPDYSSALSVASEEAGEIVDYVAAVQETPAVTQEVLATVNNMEQFSDLAIALAGLPPETEITEDMSTDVPYDTSRLQVKYPARNPDDESTIGSFLGQKSSLGIDRSAMGTALDTQGRMRTRISTTDEINLINNNVVPIASNTGGAKIVDDPTTVTDSNSEEAGMRQGYARIVMDSVIEIVHANEEPFIGKLNSQANRNALETILKSRLSNLQSAQAIQQYHVDVSERDSMSVDVNVTVDTTDPLRNIYNRIAAGRVLESGE